MEGVGVEVTKKAMIMLQIELGAKRSSVLHSSVPSGGEVLPEINRNLAFLDAHVVVT